jgi:hypothetical protein
LFCPNCGKEQANDAIFCHNCGQRLMPFAQNTKPDQPLIPYNTTATPETGKTKNRHGCLLAYLIFLIVVFASVVIYYIAAASFVNSTLGLRGWTLPVLIILGLLDIVCAVALLRWKKWGFWGFCALAVITLIVNISSGSGIATSLTGLIGIAVMYGVLNIGDKDNKGWPQLD